MNEIYDKWKNLRITNNFIFSKVMQDDEICRKILEMLLGFKVGSITHLEVEKTIDITPTAKRIRLDVYIKDEDKTYNVEMQVADTKNLPKRSRYYQSMIDLNTIEKGQLYTELKDSYVIFICTFDPFDKSLPIYTFENTCTENNNIKLDDRTFKIFFNAKDYNQVENNDLKHFMAYVNGICNKENYFIDRLDSKVSEIKSNKKWREDYMTLQLLEQ